MKFPVTAFLRAQYTTLPPIESMLTDFAGKTVIVSGSNTGLGLECARHIASMMGDGPNAGRLILACRNVNKGTEALESIHATTTYRAGEVWQIDLADFASVSAFVDKFEKEGGGHLDLLIENSGINTRNYSTTKDGWESTLQINHLGTSLLAILMLPFLTAAPSNPPFPRLTIVASDVHYWIALKPEEIGAENILKKLNDKDYCTSAVMGKRYFVSKMLNVFFMRALSARTPTSSPVVVNAINPGLCMSELTREMKQSFIMNLILNIMMHAIARTTEQGGRTLVHAAVSTEPHKLLGTYATPESIAALEKEGPKAAHGKFFHTCRITEESDFVISEEGAKAQERLWNETVEILAAADSRVPAIIQKYLNAKP